MDLTVACRQISMFLLLSGVLGRVLKRSPVDTLQAEISITEEQSIETVGENLNLIARQALERASLQWTNLRPVRFTLLENNDYFRICPNEALNISFLCLKSRLDRESLCPTEDTRSPADKLQLQGEKPFDPMTLLSGQSAVTSDCSMTLLLIMDFLNTFEETTQQRILSIVVRVLDINDNAPSWSIQKYDQPFRRRHSVDGSHNPHFASTLPVLDLRIRERMKPGSKIELPQAVDPDAYPENTTAAYGIASSEEDDAFSLEWTGRTRQTSAYSAPRPANEKLWLIVNKELDRDAQKTHHVKIFAVDGGTQAKTGHLLLNITVEDVNNHPPEFEKRKDLVWVLEHSPIGTTIYRLRATDKDESDIDKLVFSLSPSSPPSVAKLFSVDSRTGEIRLQGELDYEKETSYELQVSVSDGLWFDETTLTVALLNINDNPPEITLHSHLAVSSSFPSFLDSHHRIPGSQLTIEVMENGPSDQLIATFTVTDPDDAAEERFLQTNTPLRDTFLQANGLTLQQAIERMRQTPQCKLNNDFMQVHLISQDSRSSLARFQIRLANKPVDREISAKHLIRIECWDQANRFGKQVFAQSTMAGYRNAPARSTSVMFTLIVLDENDSVPQFIVPTSKSLAEGQPAGTIILTVTAKDADDPYTLNGQLGLQYNIVSSPDVVFAHYRSTNLSSLPTRDPSTWFTLEPRTGELRSAIVFDRETIESVNLTIAVTDGGVVNVSSKAKHNSATIAIQINITDVNDCQPTFDRLLYQLNVSEGATPPLLVGKVTAEDCDADEANRRLHYWLQQSSKTSSAGRWFTISRNGELYLGAKGGVTSGERFQDWRPLDREREETIVLEVYARDHGQPSLTGSARIIIRLEDVNDNSPVWQFPKPHDRFINVSLEGSVGQRIAQLSATDLDVGPRGRVTYHIISGNEEGHFELDEQSGCLYIGKPFTSPTLLPGATSSFAQNANSSSASAFYENHLRILALKTFRLYLRATDHGDPPRQTTGVLDIRLTGPPKPTTTSSSSSSPPSSSSSSSSSSNQPLVSIPTRPHQRQPPISFLEQRFASPEDKNREIPEGEGLVSSESLVVIAIMVAAVAALLFIVVLLTVACLRKRMLTTTPGVGDGRRRRPEDGETKTVFELIGEGKQGGSKYFLAAGSPSQSQQNAAGPGAAGAQYIDAGSTYVTVTRNSLRRTNNQREIISIPSDITPAFGVQSLDNLSSIQADVFSPYRLENDASACGLLLQGVHSSGLLSCAEDNHEKKVAEFDGRKITNTTYTLTGKTPVICSTPGATFGAITPQTMPRNAAAAYVALSPTAVAYTADESCHTHPSERLVLAEEKCGDGIPFDQKKQVTTGCIGGAPPLLIALAKHHSAAGFVVNTEDGGMTYTSLTLTPQQQQDRPSSPNQESSFV